MGSLKSLSNPNGWKVVDPDRAFSIMSVSSNASYEDMESCLVRNTISNDGKTFTLSRDGGLNDCNVSWFVVELEH